MRELPEQFRNPNFRFLLIPKRSKKPIGKWKDKSEHLRFDDPKVIAHLENEGNIGVIGGYGGLVVIDCDMQELVDYIQGGLPQTLVEKTAKGLHIFYIIEGVDFYKSVDIHDEGNNKEIHYGEIRGDNGHQTVITPSIHESGIEYKIFVDKPIATVTMEDLKKTILPFDTNRKVDWKKYENDRTILFPISKLVDLSNMMQLTNGEYQGRHPIHDSVTGQNFTVNIDKNVWHCFRHNCGGSTLHLIAMKEGLLNCGDQLSTDVYLKCMQIAQEKYGFELIKDKIMKILSPKTDFISVASDIIKETSMYYDEAGLWWIWNGIKWICIDDIDVLNAVYSIMNWSGIINQDIKSQLLVALKMVARTNKPKEPKPEWILTMSGIYDISTGEVFEASKEYFFTNIIPWKIGTSEDCENIDAMITAWNEDKSQQIYEIMAYALYRSYPIQRVFCILGSGGNGKGSFVRLLNKLLGQDNISSFSMARLVNDKFQTAKLFNKLIGVATEIDYGMFQNTSLMKALVGGDPIPIEFKNKQPFDFFNYAKIIISTNSLPATVDQTPGFYRRWFIIDFPHEFPDGKEITDSIPPREFENLLRKLLNLLPKLLDKRKFTNEGDWKEKRKEYETKSNPVDLFIQKFCISNRDESIAMFEFRDKFIPFCIQNGYRKLNDKEIWGLLGLMGFDRSRKRIKKDDGMEIQIRCINGLDWKVIPEGGLGEFL